MWGACSGNKMPAKNGGATGYKPSSSIRTIPSAPDSHRICKNARGLIGTSRITAGGEFHPAPKTAY